MTYVDTSSPNNFRCSRALGGSNSLVHYCGGNTNVGKIGLAIRGAGAYTVCGLMGKNIWTHAIRTRQKTTKKKQKTDSEMSMQCASLKKGGQAREAR